MYIFNSVAGRLGNAIFRYFASIVFSLIYNGIISNGYGYENSITINDNDFIILSNNILDNNIQNIQNIDRNKNYNFRGYFQHDLIYRKFKNQIIHYIKNNPVVDLVTDHNEIYKSIDLIECPYTFQQYDIVVHLRLEDFVTSLSLIHPKSLKNVLEKIDFTNKTKCFVVKKPTTQIEEKYIDYFKEFEMIIESNDPITDFHIMKNAKILVCSCSTLSWCASFLSETIETCYFPNYNNPDRIWETFKKPIDNTILYDFEKCPNLEEF